MTIAPTSIQNPNPVRFALAETALSANLFVALTPTADAVTQAVINPLLPPPVIGVATQSSPANRQCPIGFPGGIYPVRANATIAQGDAVAFDQFYRAVPASDPSALGVVGVAVSSVTFPPPPGEDDTFLILLSGSGAGGGTPAVDPNEFEVYNDSPSPLLLDEVVQFPEVPSGLHPVGTIPAEVALASNPGGRRVLGVMLEQVAPNGVGRCIGFSASRTLNGIISSESGPNLRAGEPLYVSAVSPGRLRPYDAQNPSAEGVGYLIDDDVAPGSTARFYPSRWQLLLPVIP